MTRRKENDPLVSYWNLFPTFSHSFVYHRLGCSAKRAEERGCLWMDSADLHIQHYGDDPLPCCSSSKACPSSLLPKMRKADSDRMESLSLLWTRASKKTFLGAILSSFAFGSAIGTTTYTRRRSTHSVRGIGFLTGYGVFWKHRCPFFGCPLSLEGLHK